VPAPTAPRLSAGIPPQSLASALVIFAEQTGLQYGFQGDIEARQSRGARAGATPAQALTQLLECTGLTFVFVNPRTIGIYRASLMEEAVAGTCGSAARHGMGSTEQSWYRSLVMATQLPLTRPASDRPGANGA